MLLAIAGVTGTYAIAQSAHQSGTYGVNNRLNIFEKQSYIRDCRDINLTVQGAEVYTSSDLEKGKLPEPIQVLNPGVQVRLTGMLLGNPNAYTAAQIYLDGATLDNGHAVGWVRVNKLTPTTQFCPP